MFLIQQEYKCTYTHQFNFIYLKCRITMATWSQHTSQSKITTYSDRFTIITVKVEQPH